VGRVNNGDTITIVWSQLIDAPTLCSGWSNTGVPKATNIKWTITDGGTGNDILAPVGTSGTCATGMHVGTIDLGADGYNTNATSAIEFPNSAHVLSYSGTQTTLTITLGGQTKGRAGTVATGAAATLTPDSALTDRSGNTCGENLAQTPTTVQF
jgi:hypothetical protein